MQKNLKSKAALIAITLASMTSYADIEAATPSNPQPARAPSTQAAATPTAQAAAPTSDSQTRSLENRVAALEQRKGGSGMINPQGRPQVKDGWDLFVFGDLIYWNAHENGLDVGIFDTSGTLKDGEVDNVHGKWNFGYRVGAGYNTPHDGWDVKVIWMAYTDNGTKLDHASAGTTETIFPTLIAPSFNSLGTASKLRSRWGMRIDQLDLDLGREFFVSKWLTLRPHGGLRTDWVKQKLTAIYKNPRSQASKLSVDMKDRCWGIGLEGGLDSQWSFGRGWSIFADLAAAITYGHHHVEDKIVFNRDTTPMMDVVNRYRISSPILDMAMGLRWDNMFDDDRFHLGVQFGWENHIYFSQNQFPIFVNSSAADAGIFASNQGDLTLQGYTFSARFDF